MTPLVAKVRARLVNPAPYLEWRVEKADLAALCDRVEALEAALREIATFDASGYSRWPSIIAAMRAIAAKVLG